MASPVSLDAASDRAAEILPSSIASWVTPSTFSDRSLDSTSDLAADARPDSKAFTVTSFAFSSIAYNLKF